MNLTESGRSCVVQWLRRKVAWLERPHGSSSQTVGGNLHCNGLEIWNISVSDHVLCNLRSIKYRYSRIVESFSLSCSAIKYLIAEARWSSHHLPSASSIGTGIARGFTNECGAYASLEAWDSDGFCWGVMGDMTWCGAQACGSTHLGGSAWEVVFQDRSDRWNGEGIRDRRDHQHPPTQKDKETIKNSTNYQLLPKLQEGTACLAIGRLKIASLYKSF